MKRKRLLKEMTMLLFAVMLLAIPTAYAQDGRKLVIKQIHPSPVVDHNHPDVVASNNQSGFETGRIVKLNGTYHMFVNEMFERAHRDMRIAYWTSEDAISWKRNSTLVESIPGRSPYNPRSEVWVTAVVFNDEENAWNMFYVAYRAGDESKGENLVLDYEGKVWRAKSVHPGKDGIAGPYADMEIVMQPDENSQEWEGQQAVATFNPYKVGNNWYAFYDGHNHHPRGKWLTGIAAAKTLNGPWTRMPEGFNPVHISAVFDENQQVTPLRQGGYLTVFDSLGDYEIGYSLSDDGINWIPERRLKVQSDDNLWAEPGDHATRTPLGAIEEEDGTFTILYTAKYKKGKKVFYGIGRCVATWE